MRFVPDGGDGSDRLVRAGDLVTAPQIAQRLGVDPVLITAWGRRQSYDFPAPVARVGIAEQMRLWLWSEVEAWARRWDMLQTSGMATPPPEEHDELLTAKQVSDLLGWTSSGTPWQMANAGRFPPPVQQHGRTRLWSRADVERWASTARRQPNRRKKPSDL